MSLYYSAMIAVFAIVLAMIAIDPNVGVFIDLQIKNLGVQIKRQWYLLTIGSTVKFENWKMMRRLKKMRRELGLPDEESE